MSDYLNQKSELFFILDSTVFEYENIDDIRNEVGEKAEILAIEFERQRLIKSGFPELSELIERHSLIDSFLGYDIMSFQGSGTFPTKKRYIEVKGTVRRNYQFVFTKNERAVAKKKGTQYWIYCFKEVGTSLIGDKKPLLICNPIDRLKKMIVKEEPIDIFYCFE